MISVQKIKSISKNIPLPIGLFLSHIPYNFRPGYGWLYNKRKNEIILFDQMSTTMKKEFIFKHVKAIVDHAWNNIPFYRNLYQEHDFTPFQLKEYPDLQKIPIISKSMLQKYKLEYRSLAQKNRILVNTGGSSGIPLAFYILPNSLGHEWAHMHYIWEKLKYSTNNIKLMFGGEKLKNAIEYDGLRNSYLVNIYRSFNEIATLLRPIAGNKRIRFLHGYPSAIYEFAKYCESEDNDLANLLRDNLWGAFLSSEYPAPIYRKKIEEVFKIPTISWYGHTERSVLAWEEKQAYEYVPFQTYGYAEAKIDLNTGNTKLIATSYYNTASPFIRYDTGDEIKIERIDDGILKTFRIEGGREGDFIIDNKGKNISLTGLIFGRHHSAFNYSEFIQIGQTEPGKAVLFVTVKKSKSPDEILKNGFDKEGVDIEFECKIIDSPIVTKNGKVKLKVEIYCD